MSKKCSTAQRFIRTEMTTYRIGILGIFFLPKWTLTKLSVLSIYIVVLAQFNIVMCGAHEVCQKIGGEGVLGELG